MTTQDRARGLRKKATDAEKKLWEILRSRQLAGYKFRRQHPIDRFIADFACPEFHVIIEADGGQHLENERDDERARILENLGWRVLRFWNHEILENTDGVAQAIITFLAQNPPHPPHSKARMSSPSLAPLPPQKRAERGVARAGSSADILERFRVNYGKDIDLTLRPAYRDLLAKLGDPHQKIPPVFHVAGTNGKGSTCAFLRAMLEAQGYKVHVYTSPHLVSFYERIRIAGDLIGESELAEILTLCEQHAPKGKVSYFEAATIAAFVAFARHKADFTILETGLGGRLDATNIVDKPLATIITRLSFDHREYLGDSIEQIAREKAGIMRPGVACYTMAQPQPGALQALRDAAAKIGAPLVVGGVDWKIAETTDGFRFTDALRNLDLPPPALLGPHQYHNAGLAIAATASLPHPLSETAIREGLRQVQWPARLQKLIHGPLAALAPVGAELWLDGGHNDSAGEALAQQIARWRDADGVNPRPLYVICGMLTTKNPQEFLGPFAKDIAGLRAVPIPDEALSFTAAALAQEARKLGIDAAPMPDVSAALRHFSVQTPPSQPPRILICGSLYLAGAVLGLTKL